MWKMKNKNPRNDKNNIKDMKFVESTVCDPGFFAENTSDWLWAIDLGLRYIYSSGQILDILGYRPDEICDKNFFDLTHGDDVERVRLLFEKAVRCGEKIDIARVGIHKNGRLVALRTVAGPFYDESGNIAGYRGIDSDITKYNLEEKLQESQDIFSLFMQNFPGGVYIKDSETRLLFFNKRFEELLGVKLDGMTGKTDEEIWGDEFGKSMWVEDMKVLIQGKCEEREESWTLAPTGKTHAFISRRFQIPKHGKSPLLGGITIDITERKDVENALKRSERLYYTTINSMFDWIFVIDEEMKIVLMNAAFKAINEELGLESDLVGKHISALAHFLSKDLEEEYGRIFTGGHELFIENTLKIGGRALILEIRKTPVFDGEKVVRVVTNIRDITERKRVE
ncbi:MAG TPA: PAS domain-containing protein, partial [Candidatus Wallbacteria bacterium]|nr:PAS domain-containing protein [Candidatus Wallbacteria bacterium]